MRIFDFCAQIVDATHDLVCAFKPQIAYFAAHGCESVLQDLIAYSHAKHPEIPVILDAKRGDIGNTSRMYAEAFFNQLHCDAITVAPYMGADSVQPFTGFQDKWVILLALTSNAGSADFQQTVQEGEQRKLFEKVLVQSQAWGTPENMMYVVGATHPEAFAGVRALAPEHFLLVPGVGAQGGDLEAICVHGLNKDCGLLVNSSRGILYASAGIDFAEKARAEALALQQSMAAILEKM
jgi:orotidine-5'-phosphate decarboxylase